MVAIRSAEDVLRIVKERNLSVRINPGPPRMPVLVCPAKAKDNATDALMEALKAWRVEIMAIVGETTNGNGVA